MDPNKTLQDLRKAIRRLNDNDAVGADGDVRILLDTAEALDGWLSSGGFLPADWRRVIRWEEPR